MWIFYAIDSSFLRESQRFWQNVELRKRIRMWQQQSGQWWYCCFHALQKGDINKVVPIDKSSTVLSILLALIFLREGITGTKIVSVLLIGIEGIDSNLGTAIRTTVVLLMAWLMVFITGKQKEIKAIEKKELCFICLSGLATGASWLCYYRALQEGQASVVVPIDKLSMLVTIAFSWIVFHKKLTKKAAPGVLLITAGTVLLAII